MFILSLLRISLYFVYCFILTRFFQFLFMFLAMLLCIWLLSMLGHDDRYIYRYFCVFKELGSIVVFTDIIDLSSWPLVPTLYPVYTFKLFCSMNLITLLSIILMSAIQYPVFDYFNILWLFQFSSISLAISVAISLDFLYSMC